MILNAGRYTHCKLRNFEIKRNETYKTYIHLARMNCIEQKRLKRWQEEHQRKT